jgi:hypothetical protein
MTDLTKITTPFGLLDAETQAAMKADSGPIELFNGCAWIERRYPEWCPDLTYRVRPKPPKPREWWLHPEKKQAISYSSNDRHDTVWIHVREVLE